MKACVEERFGRSGLEGLTIAVQGLGNVGFHLAKLLCAEGTRVIGTDLDEERVKQAVDSLSLEAVKPDEIYDVRADIFAPCGLGAVVNDQTIERMQFKIIAGAANNQLEENRHGLELHQRGILYAPDYVINAGGMINVFVELEGYDRERALRMSRSIFYNLRKVLQIARKEKIPTNEAADKLVEERIAMMRHLKAMYTGPHTPRYRWETS
jgi:leucine dehydrogenase